MAATQVVELDELRRFLTKLFEAGGLSTAASTVVIDSLLEADLQGIDTHGIQLIPMYLERLAKGTVSRHEQAIIVSDAGATALLDARDALGQLTAPQAVALASTKARKFGIGAVSVRNAFHIGALRKYACELAGNGCIGIVLTNTRPMMPPPGGHVAVAGNNPLAIAISRSDHPPVVVDFAQSAVSIGKIRLADAEGHDIPEHWATDAQGNPTSDPAEAIKGMLQAAGGPKGFVLALMVDLLCGGLSGGGVGADVKGLYLVDKPYNSSQLFIAIDAEHFAGEQFLRTATEQLALDVENAGGRVPGLSAAQALADNDGSLAVRSSTLENLNKAARQLGLEDFF